MPRTTVFSCLGAAAISLAAPSVHAETPKEVMTHATEAFDAALRSDDTALAPVFTEDGVWMPSTGGRFEGHAALEQALAGYPDLEGFEVSFTEEVPLGEDHVFHHGTFSVTLPAEAGGGVKTGEFIVLSKLTPDGLKMIRHIGFGPRGSAAQCAAWGGVQPLDAAPAPSTPSRRMP